MNSGLILKKIDKNIDNCIKNEKISLNIEQLIGYIIDKINRNRTNESVINDLETILLKLLQNGFNSTVKSFCFYIISNFYQEFNEQFFISMSPLISSGLTNMENFEKNINSLRNFVILNQKEIIDNIPNIENIFKGKDCDINYIINCYYFSNFPILLLNIIKKIPEDEIRQYKDFLSKFFLELGKLLLISKLQDVTFLNLIQILSKILSNFSCLTDENENFESIKLINSSLMPLAEYLIIHLEEIIYLMKSFDNKLLAQSISFPINLYKIYNYFKDENNKNNYNKYERNFHNYMKFIFQEIRNLMEPDIFSEFTKIFCEYQILIKKDSNNISNYSTEIIELLSKFITLIEHLDKSMWFDNNIKNLSFLIKYIDYNETMEYVLILLKETYHIKNNSDRIITLYNLFNSIVFLSINYSDYFENESVILCLFKQEWFVVLVNKSEIEEKESRWRHDIFICLIESIFNITKYLLKKRKFDNYINIIKLCQDIVDVCFKILDWKDEGESFKMYFLILEKTCLFFGDAFYNYLYGKMPNYINMKNRLDDMLNEICKRFYSKKWDLIVFANEYSKYHSLLILCKYLKPDQTKDINDLLELIKIHLKEMNFEIQNQSQIEKLLLCLLFLGIRVEKDLKEKIIKTTEEYVEYLKNKINDKDMQLIGNILSLTENILYYLIEHKDDLPIILDSKKVDQLTNEFYLIISKDIDINSEAQSINYNTLYLMNLTENSFGILDNCKEYNSSVFLDYFKKLYYFPLLEYNNDNCHILIDNNIKYISNEWTLITGIADAIHIYYRYILDIETREIIIFLKNYNSTNVVLNNVVIFVYLNENIVEIDSNKNISDISKNINNTFQLSPEHRIELLSPNSSFDFSIKCYSKVFDLNFISVESQFDMVTDQKGQFNLRSEPFYIPLTDFFIPDKYALFDTEKYEIFYSTLEYAFSTKCFSNCSSDVIVNDINSKVTLIEYKSNNITHKKQNEIMDDIIKNKYNEYYEKLNNSNENTKEVKKMENNKNKHRENFKIKLSTYCVYNFWIYIFIIGDYNSMYNKAILNIDFKTNDLKGLNVIAKEKQFFINELISPKIKFY